MASSVLVLAQLGGGGGGMSTLIFLGLMMAVMYFVMILPQQKQAKQHRALLASLKKGDEVVTRGGMLGKIYAVTDKIVTLEVSSGVRIRVIKAQIEGRTQGDEEAAPAKVEEPKEEK